MINALIAWAATMPHAPATVLLSALPVTELRLALPVAITVWGIEPMTALLLALLGNALPFLPIFYGFMAFRRFAERRMPVLVTWLDRLLAKAHRKAGANFAKYGVLGLAIFVAVPLPGTGVWMGTLAGVALKLSLKQTAAGVLGGLVVMGLIVLVLTLSGQAVVD